MGTSTHTHTATHIHMFFIKFYFNFSTWRSWTFSLMRLWVLAKVLWLPILYAATLVCMPLCKTFTFKAFVFFMHNYFCVSQCDYIPNPSPTQCMPHQHCVYAVQFGILHLFAVPFYVVWVFRWFLLCTFHTNSNKTDRDYGVAAVNCRCVAKTKLSLWELKCLF